MRARIRIYDGLIVGVLLYDLIVVLILMIYLRLGRRDRGQVGVLRMQVIVLQRQIWCWDGVDGSKVIGNEVCMGFQLKTTTNDIFLNVQNLCM